MKMYQDDNEESFAEYSISDEPVIKSFYDKYGFDERDGPPEEEEEGGYRDDTDN